MKMFLFWVRMPLIDRKMKMKPGKPVMASLMKITPKLENINQ